MHVLVVREPLTGAGYRERIALFEDLQLALLAHLQALGNAVDQELKQQTRASAALVYASEKIHRGLESANRAEIEHWLAEAVEAYTRYWSLDEDLGGWGAVGNASARQPEITLHRDVHVTTEE